MGKGGAGPGLSDGAKSWRQGHAVGHLGAGHGAGGKVPSEGLGLAALGCFHLLQPSRLLCILEKFRPR